MKKMFTFNSKSRSRWMLLLLLLVAGVTNTLAQNVTISPQNGSMICSDASGSGTSGGAFSMWRHEQLALTMVASGATDLTDEGILKNHRNWFNTCNSCTFRPAVSDADKAQWIDCGWQGTGYYTISLPKGYRFTSYRFVLSHDIYNPGQGFNINTTANVTFAETGSNFASAVQSVTLPAVPGTNGTATIETLTRTGDDMGNVLYFKTTASNNSTSDFYDLTFRYVELTFTADADTHVDIQPSTTVSTGRSFLEVPFNTGKVDLGPVTQRVITQNNGTTTRISYSLANFKDMAANMLLYEAESVRSGTGFDGTSGDVAYNKDGSITTAGDFFKLSTGTKEQVYYLESPVYATMQNNESNPIQFRIVGANVEYNNGSSITKSYDEFTMSRVYNNVTYYIGDGYGRYTSATNWVMDEDGYVRCGTNGARYLTIATASTLWATITYITTTATKADAPKFKINGDHLQVDGGTYNNYYVSYGQQNNNTYYWRLRNDASNQPVTITKTGTKATLAVSASTGECTLKVYDKTGNSVVPNGEVTVNNSNKSGNIPLPGLNNDAIKFSVKGTGFVKLSVILQALNPYIDQMSVVMNDEAKNLRMTQTFTSDDFSVGGDTFVFYLPDGCQGDDITMTFEDLYSKYGDDTYDHTTDMGTSDSRYNFVKSQHHQAFTNDNIYNGKAEAASDVKESVRIANKQNVRTQVGTVGNVAFRFNNADELSTTAGYMTEYPFTLANYANQTKPGAGSFVSASIEDVGMSTNPDADKKTFYVFTTDETKYNIAPTTATQHRSYAFYAMEVQLICQDYDPTVTFEKIYSNSFNETGKTEFYGATVSALVNGTQGLAADFAVNKAIAEKIANPGEDDVPASMDQILYLDMSQLKGVFHSDASKQEDKQYEVTDFNALKNKFAKNALVFLPINSTSTFNNFAYAMKGQTEGSLTFKAANNFILTDKNPFYSPYTIQVDAANYAVYTRKLTKSTYSGEEYATVIMPFTIKFDEGNPGVKTDANYGTFTFLQMQEDNATSEDYNYKTAFFKKTKDAQVEANTPYALHVENKGESTDCFTLRQYGSDIVATPASAKSESGKTLFSATAITSTGNLTDMDGKNHTYTFNHKGSFSGYKIPKNSPTTFYFANNGFYSSADLKSTYTTVDLLPFRSVYEIPTGGSAKFGFVRFMEGENTTGIVDINRDNNYSGIATGEGTITITADAAGTYRIFSAAGQNASNVTLRAGETKTVNVPAGVYVVNGVKVLVK